MGSKVLATIGTLFLAALLHVLRLGYQRRSKINKLRKQGMAMPPWSWWFGHLLVLQTYLNDLPPNVNVFLAMRKLLPKHSDTEAFLMDYWPMFDPVIMIFSPEMSVQVSSTYNLPKPESQYHSLRPIVGGPSLISMNDTDWKFWRSLFNPGFSAAAMMNRVPLVVDAVEIFCQRLRAKAGKGIFSLDNMATSLTFDIITKATLDTDLSNQDSEHLIAHCLNTILAWHSFWDPRILLNPLRPFIQHYYGNKMDKFIQKEIHKRFQEMKTDMLSPEPNRLKHSKSVIALALDDYISERLQKRDSKLEDLQLDENFARIAANQIRLFIFAGNDSTSSSMVYTYHLLSKHPQVAAKLREEHDNIFGPVVDSATKIKENPALLNQCKYTLAVIKETLRLYPPSSSLRQGRAGVSITDIQGNTYPMEDLGATIMHNFVHTNARFWPRPHEFLPERWLVEPGHELYTSPNNGAYRPFEQGPRNCIGQTLVMNEMRAVLILTVRAFDISPAYDEFDALQREKESVFGKVARWTGLKGGDIKTVDGERAYQTSDAGAHPADRYPCRVSLRT